MKRAINLSKLTREEFKTCFDQNFDAIRDFIYYRCGDIELASDLAQEVFLKTWEKRNKLDSNAIKGLLYKMAKDLFISQLRKDKVANKYVNTLEIRLENQDPNSSLQYKELKKRYESALAALPEKQREVFMMNRLEELTYKEIADRLGLSVKAVEKRMSAALVELRKIQTTV